MDGAPDSSGPVRWSPLFILDPAGEVLAKRKDLTRGPVDALYLGSGEVLVHGFGGTMRLWWWKEDRTVELRGHTGAITSMSLSPNGTLILSTSHDHTARLWSRSGEERAVLRGHEDSVLSGAFSPDGQRVVTSSRDRTARIWSIHGQSESILRGHRDQIFQALFSPDGQEVLTLSRDGTARLHPVKLEDLVALARSRCSRELTPEERRRYLEPLSRGTVGAQ